MVPVKRALEARSSPYLSQIRPNLVRHALSNAYTPTFKDHSFVVTAVFRFFVSIIDDYSRYCWVYMLSSKDEVTQKIKDFHARVTTKYNARIIYFRSDNGGEYTLRSLVNFFTPLGITHEFSVPDAHQQNSVAERWNQTIYTMARCARLHFSISEYFWPYAIKYAVHVYNRTPHSALPYPSTSRAYLMTPYEALKGSKPNISTLSSLVRQPLHVSFPPPSLGNVVSSAASWATLQSLKGIISGTETLCLFAETLSLFTVLVPGGFYRVTRAPWITLRATR